MARLKSAIKHYETHYKKREDRVRVGENLININEAYEFADRAEIGASIGDEIANKQYEELLNTEYKDESNPSMISNKNWSSLADKMRNKDREDLANFKNSLRQQFYG